MANKDIFDDPFDEGTLTKLEIFEKYFEVWLPTFLMSNFNKPIQVFDLFAGIGYDKVRQEGSPIRILKIINKYRNIIESCGKKVCVYLNDNNHSKYEMLSLNTQTKISEFELESLVQLKVTNLTFVECLKRYHNELIKGCNLLFIDQNGFKEVNEEIFKYLIKLEVTEFIFFLSSSHIHRFATIPEVQKTHPKFDFGKIRTASRKKVHNVVCEEYEKYVPNDIHSYGLFPFSIIKSDNNNVYGLIFVSKHILGADKFLDTVWHKNPINGNANFDIDDDLSKIQPDLFEGKRLTKIEAFQNKLKEKILNRDLKNNSDAYFFTINAGHIHNHADQIIRDMKRQKLIDYESSSPLVNYEQIIKKRRFQEFKVNHENNKN